jgi:hypothetical protein
MAEDISKQIPGFIEPFRVTPGSSVQLARDFDPGFKAGIEKKQDGVGLLNDGIELLTEYQARLAAQDTYGVLVVLQALDAAGKDGTIRHVMSGLNPQGESVESRITRRCSSFGCIQRTSSARSFRSKHASITCGSTGTTRSTIGSDTCPRTDSES